MENTNSFVSILRSEVAHRFTTMIFFLETANIKAFLHMICAFSSIFFILAIQGPSFIFFNRTVTPNTFTHLQGCLTKEESDGVLHQMA